MIQPPLFNLYPNECSQGLSFNPFVVKLDKCVWSCNTLNEIFNRVCVPNKAEDINLSVFNMISRINEWKALSKHASRKFECKFDGRKWNWNQKWNNGKCQCKFKNWKEHNAFENIWVYDIAFKTFIGGKTIAY